MALRKKKLCWYAYYRDSGRIRSVSLHTRDEAIARRLHAQLMETIAAAKMTATLRAKHPELFPAAERKPEAVRREFGLPEYHPRANRLKLADMIEVAREHRKLSDRHVATFKKFCAAVAPKRYADEITPQLALDYLDKSYPLDTTNGKGYNNTLTQLNVIFKMCLVRANLNISPFATVPRRIVEDIEHYRPLTEDEFRAIFAAAVEPWKTASLLSWHTGLRLETCFKLAWEHIDPSDTPPSITIIPGKTARFGNKAVYIPIHPELWERLISLPRPDDDKTPILSQWPANIHYPGYHNIRYFPGLLAALGIKGNAEGKANFHSFRSSLITRCDEYGIARRATQGVVGQSSDWITDLYSHDKETAKQILTLPGVLS